MHTSGDQRLAGDIYIRETQSSNPDIFMCWTDIHKGDVPEKNYNMAVHFTDDRQNVSGRMGSLVFTYLTDQTTRLGMTAYKASEDSPYAGLWVNYPVEGDPYTIAPSTRDEPADNEIVTVDYLKKDNGTMHTTGDETIDGEKTFTGIMHIAGIARSVRIHDTTYTNGVIPETNKWHGAFTFYDDSGNGVENGRLGHFRVFTYADTGTRGLSLKVFDNVAVEDEEARPNYGFEVLKPLDGPAYATAPNTRETPQDNEIVTVDYLKKYVADALSQASTSGSGFPEPELQPTMPDAGV